MALEETKRLDNISINKNPSSWDTINNQNIKVMTLNCAGLTAHMEDIKTDNKIMQADMIQLIETSLNVDEANPLMISGYEVHDFSIGNGMGISTYYKGSRFKYESSYVTSEMQVVKFTSEELQVITVYRSSRGSLQILNNNLNEMVSNTGQAVLITGDFNLCIMMNKTNIISKNLENLGFQQLMKEATQIKGGHIDHVYWRNGLNNWMDPILLRYSPYYTDHDASLVTIIGE